MKLIIDSGSSKSDWCVLEDDKILKRQEYLGLNPRYMSEPNFSNHLNQIIEKLDLKQGNIDGVHFYSTGVAYDNKDYVSSLFNQSFKDAVIEVQGDLVGAARAIYGRHNGLIGILGTGSNSGYYESGHIKNQVANLGFILGDEGGGVNIGMRLIKNSFHDSIFPLHLKTIVENTIGNRAQVLDLLYGNSSAKTRSGRIAAIVAAIARDYRYDPYFLKIVEDSFVDFLDTYIIPLDLHRDLPLGLCGTIAVEFEQEFRKISTAFDVEIGKVLRRPIDSLVDYHKSFERKKK